MRRLLHLQLWLAVITWTASSGCKRDSAGVNHGHDHATGDHGHAHDAAQATDEPESQTLTLFTKQMGLFMEFPHLVKGAPATFVAHFTLLATGDPVTVGPLIFEATGPGGETISTTLAKAKRDGLYTPEVTFPTPGKYRSRFVMNSPLVKDTVDLGELIVHPDESAARDAAKSAAEPPTPNAIPFLLEQQWKIGLLTTPVAKHTLVRRLTLPGQIVAPQGASAVVSPPVAGRLLPPAGGRMPRVGERVQAGQVLARVEPPLPVTEAAQLSANQAQVQALQAELALRSFELRSKALEVEQTLSEAKSRLDFAEQNLQRLSTLRKTELASEKQLQEAQLNVSTARAANESAQAIKALYKLSMSGLESLQPASAPTTNPAGKGQFQMPMFAPIPGRIIAAEHIEGEHIDAHQEVFRIVNAEHVWVLAHVSEFDLPEIPAAPRATMTLAAIPDKPIDIDSAGGRLVDVGTVIDPASRTVPIRFELPNKDEKLRVGMYTTVNLETQRTVDSLAIPEAAIVLDNGKPTAYVMLEGESFEKRDLLLGVKDAGFVEVKSGLKEGERIATLGAYEIKLTSLSPATFGHGHAH